MPEQSVDHKADSQTSKGQKIKWWLLVLGLTGLALIFIGLKSKNQARKDQPFRTLITKSFSDVVAFSPDGKLLASAHRVNPAFFKVWDLETDTLLQTVETVGNGGIGLIAMSPDKTMIVTSERHDDERLFCGT